MLRHFLGILCCSVLLLSGGCSKPGGSKDNFTNSTVVVQSINENAPFQSDVLTNGYAVEDVVKVSLKSETKVSEDDPLAPRESPFNKISFRSYHVAHLRSDGGPNPADFTSGMTLTLEPNSEAETHIVIVRVFDKNRSPLEELRDDGEIFTTAQITFYGEDGYGNDIAVKCSLSVSFANFPDQ